MITTESKEDSYTKLQTGKVRSFQAYEKDFQTKGRFEERSYDGQIYLKGYIWPGHYDGNEWHQTPPGEESFIISLTYRNKDNVGVKFSPVDPGNNYLKEYFKAAYDLVESAAKKFFLMNEVIDTAGLSKNILIWEDLKEAIEGKKDEGKSNYLNGIFTWKKVMTVAEIKELFEYLKLEFEFPS